MTHPQATHTHWTLAPIDGDFPVLGLCSREECAADPGYVRTKVEIGDRWVHIHGYHAQDYDCDGHDIYVNAETLAYVSIERITEERVLADVVLNAAEHAAGIHDIWGER